MTIETRDFGTMELDKNEVLTFKAPILGFDDLSRYVILSDKEIGSGLLWLQSIDDANTCFILLDPEEIGLDYQPILPGDMVDLLQLEAAPALRLIAVIPEDFKKTTVNLKSPVVINTQKKLGAQVILDDDYPIRMPLFDGEEG